MLDNPQKGYTETIPEFSSLPEWKLIDLKEKAVRDATEFMKEYYIDNGGQAIPAGYKAHDSIAYSYAKDLLNERLAETAKTYSEQEIEAYVKAFNFQCGLGYPISTN